MKREQFLQKSALGIFAAITHTNALHTEDQRQIKDKRFSIGACDWSISNTSNLGAMEMAKASGTKPEHCWCFDAVFTPAVMDLVPDQAKVKACVCATCASHE